MTDGILPLLQIKMQSSLAAWFSQGGHRTAAVFLCPWQVSMGEPCGTSSDVPGSLSTGLLTCTVSPARLAAVGEKLKYSTQGVCHVKHHFYWFVRNPSD